MVTFPLPLFLKVVEFQFSDHKFVSPVKKNFIWPRDGFVERECPKCAPGEIGSNDTCGIYGVIDPDILKVYDSYADNPLGVTLLYVALGQFELSFGHQSDPSDFSLAYSVVRAFSGRPIAIVNPEKYLDTYTRGSTKFHSQEYVTGIAQDYFVGVDGARLPIISMREAVAAIQEALINALLQYPVEAESQGLIDMVRQQLEPREPIEFDFKERK